MFYPFEPATGSAMFKMTFSPPTIKGRVPLLPHDTHQHWRINKSNPCSARPYDFARARYR